MKHRKPLVPFIIGALVGAGISLLATLRIADSSIEPAEALGDHDAHVELYESLSGI